MKSVDIYVNTLRVFYEEKGLRPNSFNCKNEAFCKEAAKRPLAQGAEAHIGTNYGDPFHLVIISLDAAGDNKCLEERRKQIESCVDHGNQHMRGTKSILEAFFPGKMDVFSRFAMINAAKCSAIDGNRNKVANTLYDKCKEYAHQELKLLKPDIIVTQGALAREVIADRTKITSDMSEFIIKSFNCSNEKLNEWAKALIEEYICRWNYNVKESCWAIIAPHPSARGGQWQKFERSSLKLLVYAVTNLIQGI